MSLGRIKFTLLLVSLAELVNKLIPLFVIRIGQNRLGLDGLGHAQFSIYIVELFLPLMTWGFDIYGPISLRNMSIGSESWKARVGDIMGGRILLALLVYGILIGSVFLLDKFIPYRSTVLSLAVLMFLSGLTTTFVHTADQSLAVLARITIGAKILSLIAIAALIHSPDESALFAMLSYGVNLVIGLASSIYIVHRYGWIVPRFPRVFKTLKFSFPFALTYILAILVERVELWFAESWGGTEAVGALSGPLRLYQGLLFAIMALSAVFYSEGLAYPQKVGRFLRLTVWAMAIIIVPLTVGVFFIGEPLLVLLTGQGFQGQGLNLALICTGMFGHSLLIVAGAQALSALGHVKWTNYAYFGAFVFGSIGSLFLMRLSDPYWALLAPAFGKTVAGLSLFAIALKQTQGFKDLRLPVSGIGLGLALMVLFLILTSELFWMVRLAGAIAVYGIGFVALSYKTLLRITRKEGMT